MRTAAALALALATLAARPAAGQRPDLVGDDGSRAAALAREVLARGTYVWIDRDTILGPGFTAVDLVVHDAEVRLEGSVERDAVVLGGDLWIRPGGRVGGAVAVLGGGVYPAGLAVVNRDSIFHPDPRARVTVRSLPDAGGGPGSVAVELVPPPRPPLVSPVLTALPTYDRVNGVTVRAEVLVRPTRQADGPSVQAWAAFRQLQENRVGGGARARLPLRVRDLDLTAEASRATRTNDGWILGSVANSVRAVVLGRDHRDYWDADVLRLGVVRRQVQPLVAGESWLGPHLTVQLSRDRSLPARAPWALLDREGLARENPPVLEGTIVSVIAGTAYRGRSATARFDGSVDVEHAPAGVGDAAFTQGLVRGSYQARALRTHRLSLDFRAMAPLGGSEPPPQRHGILGGSMTLPSEPIARFRGDHLVYVESRYEVPIPWLVLPVLGSPSVEALHRVGAAWVGGDEPEWVQNAGGGLRFAFLTARLFVNPAERPLRPHFGFGLSIPQR
jgi:hypothetical protein